VKSISSRRLAERIIALLILCVVCLAGAACHSDRTRSREATLRAVDSLMATGDTTRALETVREFLRESSRRQRVDSSTVAITDSLRRLLVRFGEDELAGELYRDALRDLVPKGVADRLTRAKLQVGYGRVLTDLARFQEAHAFLDSALSTQRELLGEENPELAASFSVLGELLGSEGNYTGSVQVFSKALAVRQRFLRADDPAFVSTYNNLANIFIELAQFDSAETAYLRALRILEKHRPEEDFEYANVLQNLAALYGDRGDYTKALRFHEDALSVLVKCVGRRHPNVAVIQNGIAVDLYDLKRWDEAENRFREALALFGDLHETGPGAADCESNFGNLCLERGELDSAEVHLRKSLLLWESSYGLDHPATVAAHLNLAEFYGVKRDWPAARVEQRLGYDIARKAFLTHYQALSESDALQFSNAYRSQTSSYVTMLVASEDMREDSCRELANVVITSKGLVQDGVFARQNILRKNGDPQVRTLTDSLQMLRNRMMHIGMRMSEPGASKSLQGEFGILKSGAARLEKQLIDHSPLHYEYVDVSADSVYSTLRGLPAATFVVDYYAFDYQLGADSSEARYLAVILCDTGFVACVDLGKARSVDQKVRTYREYLENPREASSQQIIDASRRLCRAVWSPVESYLTKARLVLICPDGELNLVSFAGLCEDDGVFLIEKYPIHYLSTSRDLTRPAHGEHIGKGIVLLGNPDYTGALPPLENAEREVTNVSLAWRAAFAEPIMLLTGTLAGEREFRRWSPGARVLYFAAHSADVAADAARRPNHSPKTEDALPSGILLAEFRSLTQDSPTESDGFLTAEEISTLDLSSTDLAVLSTCESGGGKLVRGEGVYGLRRSFQMAGVRTVISTLWPVDDRSTAEMMEHGLFDSTATYPEALQKLCLKRIQELRASGASPNPFFWAAVTSAGNWRR